MGTHSKFRNISINISIKTDDAELNKVFYLGREENTKEFFQRVDDECHLILSGAPMNGWKINWYPLKKGNE